MMGLGVIGSELGWIVLLVLGACGLVFMRVWQSMRRGRVEQEMQLRLLSSRSNELEATLGSMVEGVLAVSSEGRVLSLNDAASGLLGGSVESIRGRLVGDVIVHEGLVGLIGQSLGASEPLQEELVFEVGGETRRFMGQGAVLRDQVGTRLGSLIVLHDITVLRQLEVVRRDFVSNASHEIKTPVAAIKAAAETVAEAEGDAEVLGRFLPMIVRHSDRLEALVEDLLSLARIEREAEGQLEGVEVCGVLGLLELAVEVCEAKAVKRGVVIRVDCVGDLEASLNGPLIEQAVVNLVDNAVKYSPEGGEVRVGGARVGGDLVISVSDGGCGIGEEHQPRLFERFYRTDNARSRELGGTGLGLAIVKHIAVGHGGSVSVSSREGEGATFRMQLPNEPCPRS